jgi:PAS domain S-box-containing protein
MDKVPVDPLLDPDVHDTNVSGVRARDKDAHVLTAQMTWPNDFSSIVELLPDPFVLLGPIRQHGRVTDFEFRDANRAARELLARSRGEIIGARLLSLFPQLHDTPLFSKLSASLETGATTALNDVAIDIGTALRDALNPTRYYNVHAVRVDGGIMATWYDVTDQHELTSRFQVLAENASDIVVQLDTHGVVQWISPSVREGLGWTPDELAGAPLAQYLDDASRSEWRKRLEETHDRQSVTQSVAVRSTTGNYHRYSLTTRMVGDVGGASETFIGTMRCVDTELEARDALQETQSRYQLLVEHSSDVVVLGNAERTLEWISESVSNLLGWHPSQMLGHNYLEYVHPDDLATVQGSYLRMVGGDHQEYEVRLKTSDGAYRWVAVTVHEVPVPGGEVARIASWRDAESEVAARVALEASKAQYRMLAESSSDVVYQVDLEGILRWVSPSVTRVLGWQPDELLGRNYAVLIADEDLELTRISRDTLHAGGSVEPYELRYKTSSGALRWMSIHPHPAHNDAGEMVSLVVSLRDHQNVVTLRRAAETLSAGTRLLVRVENEEDLLSEMCQIAVDQGGYAFAWYGRRVNDDSHSITKFAVSRAHAEYLDVIDVSWADSPNGQGPVGRAIRTGVTQVTGDFNVDLSFLPWIHEARAHGFRSSIGLPVRVDGEVDGVFSVYASEPYAFGEGSIELFEDLAAEIGYGIKRLRDHERLVHTLEEQTLLTSVINEAGESVVVTDAASRIIYVNPAALRTSGFELDEVLGQAPTIFRLGIEQDDIEQAVKEHLAAGETWRGVLNSRRKNGERYEEEATISPIHGLNDTVTAHVSVKRDLTTERRLEADLTREVRAHWGIVELMKRFHVGDSINETVERFCRALTNLELVDAAAVMIVQGKGQLVRVGIHASPYLGDAEAGYDLFQVPAWMLERTAIGPWWQLASEWRSELATLFETVLGPQIVANAVIPVHQDGEMVAVLMVGTKDITAGLWMESRFTSLEEMGTYAGTLFGAQAKQHAQRVGARAYLRRVIDEQRFTPVFQPFVNLASREVVGYEALTRFDDGVRPDLRFAAAYDVGLGSQLEAACAKAAMDAARALREEFWLSVNFSPATLLDGYAAQALEGGHRPLVIEITEHAPIKNYADVRRAVRAIAGCSLAVDDAGAGYTSLSHILELQPDFVKLDISLVRDIGSDPMRQAMTAGVCHFAAQTGTVVVAEGIETEIESETLLKIGAPLFTSDLLGQGFLFGRPGALPVDAGNL